MKPANSLLSKYNFAVHTKMEGAFTLPLLVRITVGIRNKGIVMDKWVETSEEVRIIQRCGQGSLLYTCWDNGPELAQPKLENQLRLAIPSQYSVIQAKNWIWDVFGVSVAATYYDELLVAILSLPLHRRIVLEELEE